MIPRRQFFIRSAAASVAAALSKASAQEKPALSGSVMESRQAWVDWLLKVATPVLQHMADNSLLTSMPVELAPGNKSDRRPFAHLEALGRTVSGIAPWLACPGLKGEEANQREKLAGLARKAISHAATPGAADRLDFTAGAQCLVDAAFLALGLLRAPDVLWEPLEPEVKSRLQAALESTRKFTPGNNNWLLFSATVEAWLAASGAAWNTEPVDRALKAHADWYAGDGTYGDGPEFHWDYYNSFVIHPMLRAVVDAVAPRDSSWNAQLDPIQRRARRYAAVQERMVAPDGTFAPHGRSLTYRCGAFHHLADTALRRDLPDKIKPAQVRGALGAVIQRTLGAAGTFDEKGWLRLGLAGHQPSLAESYICTGSLYLCTSAFLPLGLPPTDAFWSAPPAPWTARQVWEGADLPMDAALKGSK